MQRQTNMLNLFVEFGFQLFNMKTLFCTSISRNCFRLMRDWKLESLANSKDISAILFRMVKGGLPLEVLYNF